MCLYFSYNLPDKAELVDATCTDKNLYFFFPGSIQASSIVKILSSFCNRYRYNYIPNRDLWINRLYFDISNSSKKQCLTIDARDVNDLGPAGFRTQAGNTNLLL